MGLRIALIGNTNNNLFSLCRYLRARGYDAELLLCDNEHPHFHPSFDCFDEDYLSYTKQLTWGSLLSYIEGDWETVRSNLEDYDILIGSGPAPVFVNRIGRQLDILQPFGGDVTELSRFEFINYGAPLISWQNLKLQLARFKYVQDYRAGVAGTKHLFLIEDYFMPFISECGFTGERHRFLVPMVYVEADHRRKSLTENFPVLSHSDLIRSFQKKKSPIVFHHPRHVWTSGSDPISNKGNDRLIRGFADFVHKHPELSPVLITCEYGEDVNESKQLIEECRISDNVVWLPLMPRAEILQIMSLVDIGTNNFCIGWFVCGTILEVLAYGVPLMSARDDWRAEGQFNEVYSSINVSTPEEISAALDDFVKRPDYYKEMGNKGREWFQKYCVDLPVDAFVDVIETCDNSTKG